MNKKISNETVRINRAKVLIFSQSILLQNISHRKSNLFYHVHLFSSVHTIIRVFLWYVLKCFYAFSMPFVYKEISKIFTLVSLNDGYLHLLGLYCKMLSKYK